MFELTLNQGIVVTVERLVYRRTYAGLVSAQPSKDLNQQYLEHLLEEARDGAAMPVKAFLPQPKDAWLPRIACIADLESRTTVPNGEGECGSWLRVVWLQQDEGSLPRPPAALLEELAWSRDAQNFDF